MQNFISGAGIIISTHNLICLLNVSPLKILEAASSFIGFSLSDNPNKDNSSDSESSLELSKIADASNCPPILPIYNNSNI